MNLQTIITVETKYGRTPVVYFLRLPKTTIGDIAFDPVYKFGITGNIGARLRTHFKNLRFTDIIFIVKAGTIRDAMAVENRIKREAESRGERLNLLGNTELVSSHDISPYIEIMSVMTTGVTTDEFAGHISDCSNDTSIMDGSGSLNVSSTSDISGTSNNSNNSQVSEFEDLATESGEGENSGNGDKNTNRTVDARRNRTCNSCGKVFRTPAEYQRHQNRKLPCIILEVTQEDLVNPNRCIYCNRVYANIGNKNKHFKTCKSKMNK